MNTFFQLVGRIVGVYQNCSTHDLLRLTLSYEINHAIRMKNIIILLVLTLPAFTPSHAFSRGSPQPTLNISQSPTGEGIHFYPVINYTAEELSVLIVAEKLSNQLVQSKCFSDFMTKRALIETNGKTPAEVVYQLSHTNLTVPVKMYYQFTSTVGYRQPPNLTIYTNRRFHSGANACSRASNLTHEWTHTVGYTHSFKATPIRPFSVPYSINAAFTECCSCKSIKDCSIKNQP